MIMFHPHTTRLVIVILAFCTTFSAYADMAWEGTWKLNFEETDKVTIQYKDGSGTGRRNIFQNADVSIGGLPLPSLGGGVPPQSRMAAKDPEVLLCNSMAIDADGKKIKLAYDEDKKETLRSGSYRGRDTNWSKKKIQQKFKTPDRKVTKTWTVRPDGRLLVSVKINPKKDRAKTYNRVFDRVSSASNP